MTVALLPLAISQDDAHPSWRAFWSTANVSYLERQAEQRLGTPTAYWMPAVGLLGQWCWPDGSVSNAERMPPILEPVSGSGIYEYRVSADGALTWEAQFARVDSASGKVALEQTKSGNMPPAQSTTDWAKDLEAKARTDLNRESANLDNAPSQSSGNNYAWGVIAIVGFALFVDSMRKPRRR